MTSLSLRPDSAVAPSKHSPSSSRPNSSKTISRRASIEVLSDAGTPRINESTADGDDYSEDEDTVRPASAKSEAKETDEEDNKAKGESETEDDNDKAEDKKDEDTSDVGKSETDQDSDLNSSSKLLTAATIGAPLTAIGGTVLATSKKRGEKFYLNLIIKRYLLF